MAAKLSPLQLQAAATLLQNQGLVFGWSRLMGSYNSIINDLLRAINISPGSISDSNITQLETLGSSTVPALADSIPTAYIVPISNLTYSPPSTGTTFDVSTTEDTFDYVVKTDPPGYTGLLLRIGLMYLGKEWQSGWPTDSSTYTVGAEDNSIFTQAFTICDGYANLTNSFIDGAAKSKDYLADTFTDMNNLVSGELTQVNLDTKNFGDDLFNLGVTINLNNLAELGTPLALTQAIIRAGGLVSPLVIEFSAAGVNDTTILNLTNPNIQVTDAVQKKMYRAMTKITGDALEEILVVLNVSTANLTSLADLLNPYKMFPNSYQTITTPTCNGLRGIYIGAGGTVNTKLAKQLPEPVPGINLLRLGKIIPSDQALANKALAMSLMQLTNIGRLGSLPRLATAYREVETNAGLPLINAQLKPVPTESTDYILNEGSSAGTGLAQGTGENGTYVITDFLGVAGGRSVYIDQFTNCIKTMNSMDLTTLKAIYSNMYGVVSGAFDVANPVPPPDFYVVIPSGPGAGTYTDRDDAIAALITLAQTELTSFVGTDAGNTLNSAFDAISEQVLLEGASLARANVNFNLIESTGPTSIQSFVYSIPGYGLDTKKGGKAEYLESVADMSIGGGQAIVGSVRQGRIDVAVSDSGVKTSNEIDTSPASPSPQAELLPSTYTAAEAKSQIIY